ncbi:MAG: TonB-dependent receptor, partial [Selenomonas sp.]
MNPWKKKCLTLAVICSVAGTTQVYAAEKSAEATNTAVDSTTVSTEASSAAEGHDLGETTVTATRVAEPVNKVPANVTVITAKELEKRHVFSLREALAREAGVYVAPTAEVKDGLDLRGFSSPNILVMYNGQQLNTAFDGGVNWDSIPLSDIERIEIVRGASSSLYGGHAVAGVINIITKKPKKPVNPEQQLLHGKLEASHGSN